MTEHHSNEEHPEPDDRDPTESHEIVPAGTGGGGGLGLPGTGGAALQAPHPRFSPADTNSAAYVAAALQADRDRRKLEKPPKKALKEMAHSKEEVLGHRDVEGDHLEKASLKDKVAAEAEKMLNRVGPMDRPIRKLSTLVFLIIVVIACVVAFWMDFGAIEVVWRGSRTATLFIALLPALIETGTAHLYGKARKDEDLAMYEVDVGRSGPAFRRAMLILGVVHAVALGLTRGIFTSVVAGVLFMVLSISIWALVAYASYLHESPFDRLAWKARLWANHHRRMAGRAAKRKFRSYYRKFIPARREAIRASGVLVEHVRTIFRAMFLRYNEVLPEDMHGPEWVHPYLPLSAGRFAELDLPEEQLKPLVKTETTPAEAELPSPDDTEPPALAPPA